MAQIYGSLKRLHIKGFEAAQINPIITLLYTLDIPLFSIVGRVAQSVQPLTTGWRVRDRIPVGTRFASRPDRP